MKEATAMAAMVRLAVMVVAEHSYVILTPLASLLNFSMSNSVLSSARQAPSPASAFLMVSSILFFMASSAYFFASAGNLSITAAASYAVTLPQQNFSTHPIPSFFMSHFSPSFKVPLAPASAGLASFFFSFSPSPPDPPAPPDPPSSGFFGQFESSGL